MKFQKLIQKLFLIKIFTIHSWYKINLKKPRIGVLGLNPHNAELRKF